MWNPFSHLIDTPIYYQTKFLISSLWGRWVDTFYVFQGDLLGYKNTCDDDRYCAFEDRIGEFSFDSVNGKESDAYQVYQAEQEQLIGDPERVCSGAYYPKLEMRYNRRKLGLLDYVFPFPRILETLILRLWIYMELASLSLKTISRGNPTDLQKRLDSGERFHIETPLVNFFEAVFDFVLGPFFGYSGRLRLETIDNAYNLIMDVNQELDVRAWLVEPFENFVSRLMTLLYLVSNLAKIIVSTALATALLPVIIIVHLGVLPFYYSALDKVKQMQVRKGDQNTDMKLVANNELNEQLFADDKQTLDDCLQQALLIEGFSEAAEHDVEAQPPRISASNNHYSFADLTEMVSLSCVGTCEAPNRADELAANQKTILNNADEDKPIESVTDILFSDSKDGNVALAAATAENREAIEAMLKLNLFDSQIRFAKLGTADSLLATLDSPTLPAA